MALLRPPCFVVFWKHHFTGGGGVQSDDQEHCCIGMLTTLPWSSVLARAAANLGTGWLMHSALGPTGLKRLCCLNRPKQCLCDSMGAQQNAATCSQATEHCFGIRHMACIMGPGHCFMPVHVLCRLTNSSKRTHCSGRLTSSPSKHTRGASGRMASLCLRIVWQLHAC